MIKKLILFLTITALYSCNVNNISDELFESLVSGEDNLIGNQKEKPSILPEAEEYFGNIANLAKWYSINQNWENTDKSSKIEKDNPFIYKLKKIKIQDENGNRISFFDLDSEERNEFLNSWKQREARDLSEKLNRDPSHVSSGLLIKRNQAFSKVFNSDKATSITVSDPFREIVSAMNKAEEEEISESNEILSEYTSEFSDDDFEAAIIANRYLSFSVIQATPIELTPQTFVDRLKPNIKKGRILLALPGGWTTKYLMIFYPAKYWWDVGHTAIISKDAEELTEEIGDSSNITVGTSTWYDMNEELLGRSWCYKHGLSMIGQIYDVEWVKSKDEKGKWKWDKKMTELDNEKMCALAKEQLGKPYCNLLLTFASKWDAPNSFICSSLPWWLAKEVADIDISDWWNPSVYPVNLFMSENIKILDDTLE